MKKNLLILLFIVFAIPGLTQVLQLTKPSLGDVWPAYSTQRIEWTSQNIDNIMIESSLDSGRTWTIIASSYPASAQYFPWVVPNKISDSCFIRISDVLNTSTASYNRAKPFKIPLPSILIDSLPANVIAKTVLPITWVSSGINSVAIYASFNNKISFIKIADSLSAYNFYFNWVVPDSLGSSCFIKIINKEDSSVVDTSKYAVLINGLIVGTSNKFKGGSFDGHAVSNNFNKQITVLAPNKVDSIFGSTTYTIHWKQNNIDRINLKFSPDNGVSWQTILKEYPASSCNYDWTVPNTPTDLALIKVEDVSDTTIFDNSDINFVIRKKLLKIGQPDGSAIAFKQTPLPISWISGGISLLKVYTLVSNKLSIIADSIPANYESINKIINANFADSFKIVLADYSDSTTRDTSALIVSQLLPLGDQLKFHGGAYDGHTLSSNSKKSIKLLTPIGGESLSVLNRYDIKWRSENLERLSIEFSSDSGKNWLLIDSNITTSANVYSWKTPNSPSKLCLIRIINSYDASLFSLSDSVFTLTSKNIINNTDSLNWVKGTPKSIEWLAPGVDAIKISYKNAELNNWITIKDSITASNEAFNWILPNSLTDSLWLRIADFNDTVVNVVTIYNNKIGGLIQNFDPVKFHGGSFDGHTQRSNLNKLIVKRPYENEILVGGSTYTIKWTTINFEDSVLLQYSIDSGSTWVTITRTMATLGLYDWKIPISFSVQGVVNKSYSINSKINVPYTIVTTNINSSKCLIRALNISDNNSIIGITNKPFTILTTAAPNKNDLIFPVVKDTLYSKDLAIKLKAYNSNNKTVSYSVIKGTAILANDTLLINNPGTVTIAAVTPGDSTHLPSDSIFQQFCIYPNSPAIIYKGATTLCKGDSSILLSSISTNNQWFLDTIKIDGAVSSKIQINTTGNYRLASVIDGCPSNLSAQISITFISSQSIPVISNQLPLVFNIGDSTVLTSSIAVGNQWTLNGVDLIAETGQTLIVKNSGIYTVKVSSASGCSATSLPVIITTNQVQINVPVISNNKPLAFCLGDSIVLNSSINFGNRWYLDGVLLAGDSLQMYTAKVGGSYKVVNKTISSKAVEVIVYPIPLKPIITSNMLRVLVSSSNQGNQWYSDTLNTISGETNISFKPIVNGIYSVRVTINDCISAFSEKYIYQDRPNPNFNLIIDSVLNVYPNPAHNLISVTFNTVQTDLVKIELLDFSGKAVMSKSNVKDKEQIEISMLTPGIYTLSIYDRKAQLIGTYKIIKL